MMSLEKIFLPQFTVPIVPQRCSGNSESITFIRMGKCTMESRRQRMQLRKRRRRIRSSIRAAFCLVMLALTVAILNGFTSLALKLLPEQSEPETYSESFFSKLLNPDQGSQDAAASGQSGPVVCLDAGHGGKDAGSNQGDRLEKDDTLKLTLAVASYLKEQNIPVILTRSDDTFLELSERCEIANNGNADYFVSIHRNTGEGTGVENWVASSPNQETIALAKNILDNLTESGIQKNRGVKQGTQKSASTDYYVNLNTTMPSCLLELGFINDATDNQLFDEHQTDYAKAIGDAILETYRTYHPDAGSENASGSGGSDGNSAGDSGSSDGSNGSQGSSHTLNNPQIDLTSLDNTIQDWGPGVHMDDANRPVSALSFQEKYGSYNANFINPDTGGQKIIYLTLDEGYEYGCTASILDTLKAKQVQAVFFVTGAYAKDQPDLVKRMIAEGHAVGNHSATHPASGLPSQTIEQQQSEITQVHDYVKENFGYEMHLFRYPAGKFSDQSLAVINNCNYKSVFWSFAYLDYDVNNQPDQAESLNKLIERLHSGAIYLLHAESTTNTAILGDFIDQARAAGYEFALFD